jgi:mRNA interferase MazF
VGVVAQRLVVKRFDVYLVNLDPTVGSEIKKTRPCLVISPDEINRHVETVIIAPMTSGGHAYPTRISCRFQEKDGYVGLDQLRVVDKVCLVKRLGRLTVAEQKATLAGLAEMFAE